MAGAMTLIQRNTADSHRGRVFGALGAVEGIAIVAGTVAAGFLGQTVGIIPVLAVQGGGYVAAGLLVVVALRHAEPGRQGLKSGRQGAAMPAAAAATSAGGESRAASRRGEARARQYRRCSRQCRGRSRAGGRPGSARTVSCQGDRCYLLAVVTADSGDSRDRLREIEREIFARRPEHAIEPSLDRIKALVSLLGDPQRAYPVIHLTGTNGKTSTARMTETLLRARGLRTGLFTSPHLSSVQERICVDGVPLSAERFIETYEEIGPYLWMVDDNQPVPLSFFEVLTGMAFAVFADAPVDVAVIEVGMGGTWDNTNVVDGTVAVVTPISIDHSRYLGNTVEAIAADKAGIIKPGAVAVLAQQPVDAAEVLLRRVVEVGATVAREGIEFGVTSRELAVGGQLLSIRGLLGEYHDLFLPLFGAYQAGNAACALAAVEAFAGAGDTQAGPEPLGEALVREAFGMMSSPGRLEIVRRSPTVIVDSAHNPAGMAASMDALTEVFTFTDLIGILAVSEDKDVPAILDQLEPVVSELVVTCNSSPRSMSPAKLAELAAAVFGPDRVLVAARLDDAIQVAVGLADDAAAAAEADGALPGGSGILITGSVITAGDARLLLAPQDEVGRRSRRLTRHEKAVRHSADHGGDRDRPGDPGGDHRRARVPRQDRDGRRGAGDRGRAAGGLARRGPLPLLLAGGSVLQVLVVAAGAIVPAMYVLGVIFAGPVGDRNLAGAPRRAGPGRLRPGQCGSGRPGTGRPGTG